MTTVLLEAPVSEEQRTLWDMEPDRWEPTGYRETDEAVERALARLVECAECEWEGPLRSLIDGGKEPRCPSCGWRGDTL